MHRWRFLFSAALIIIIATLFRCWMIDTRPLHSDEGVNFLFVQTTNREGYYPYSHVNYHGPLFFYLITWAVNLIGESEFGLRFIAILFGILTTALTLCFRKQEGQLFPIFGALLVAISPSLVFFSRYAIHETLLVFGSLGLAINMLSWTQSHWRGHWYLAAVNLAILITTKETFTVTLFCLALAFLSTGHWFAKFHAVRVQWHDITASMLLCIVLVLFTFSSGFRWTDGLREMFLAIPQWVGRSSSDVGHVKPFIYYVKSVIFVTEPQVLLGLGLSVVLVMVRFATLLSGNGISGDAIPVNSSSSESQSRQESENTLNPLSFHGSLNKFLATWFVAALLVYSLIPYKTVWLIINITLPGTLLTAAVLSGLIQDSWTRKLGLGLTALTILSSIFYCARYNFTYYPLPGLSVPVAKAIPYGQENPFSYVHTSPGTIEVTKIVKAYWEKHPQARVLVGVEGYFPLPYYLREKPNQAAYMAPTNMEQHAKEFEILILDYYKSPWSARDWNDPNWERTYHRLSDYTEAYVFVKREPGK